MVEKAKRDVSESVTSNYRDVKLCVMYIESDSYLSSTIKKADNLFLFNIFFSK